MATSATALRYVCSNTICGANDLFTNCVFGEWVPTDNDIPNTIGDFLG